MSERNYFVHESACVEEGAIIGNWTKIWHFSHVMNGVTIGENCYFGQNVFVDKNVTIGNNVTIQNIALDKEDIYQENYVSSGHCMVFVNGYQPNLPYSQFAGSDYVITVIQQGVTIEDHALIACGVTIGKHAMVVADSFVNQDVPAYAKVAGNPALHIGWSCTCGADLHFIDEKATCVECSRTYHKRNEQCIVKNNEDAF